MLHIPIEPLISDISSQLADKYANLSLSKDDIEKSLKVVYSEIYKSVSTVRILKMAREIPLTHLYIQTRIFPEIIDIDPETLKRKKPEDIEKLIQTFRKDTDTGNPINAVEAFFKCKKAVVLGGPGFGKTTFCRYLVKLFIENYSKADSSFSNITPLFLPFKELLKGLSSEKKIELFPLISDYLVGLGMQDALTGPFLEHLLKNGKCFIAFDGFDEVAPELRAPLRKELETFFSDYAGNLFMLSSRPAAFDQKDVFKGFRVMSVYSFSKEERFAFINNWFSDQKDRGIKLKSLFGSNKGLHDLAQTPLLSAFICIAYEKNMSIPVSKVMLYDMIIDLLIKDWRLDKGLEPELYFERMIYQRLRLILSSMAYHFLELKQKIFRSADVIEFFKTRMEELGLDTENAEDFPREIEVTTGLLVEQVDGWHSFSHLTLQEFLTAEHIARNDQLAAAALKEHLKDRDWEEVFILTAPNLGNATSFLQTMWKENKATVLKALQMQVHCDSDVRTKIFQETIGSVSEFYNKFPIFCFYTKLDLIDLRYMIDQRDLINMIDLRAMRHMKYLINRRYLVDQIDRRYLINLINLINMRNVIDLRDLRYMLFRTYKSLNILVQITSRNDSHKIAKGYVESVKKGILPDTSLTDLMPETMSIPAYNVVMDFYDNKGFRHWDLLAMAVDCYPGKAMPEFHKRFLKESDFMEKYSYAAQLLDEKYQPAFEDILDWINNLPLHEGDETYPFFTILLWLDVAFDDYKEYKQTLTIMKTNMKKKNKKLISQLEYQDGWKSLLNKYDWL